MGKLLTGRWKGLDYGLVAIETKLGWTVMGKYVSENPKEENIAITVKSLFVKEADHLSCIEVKFNWNQRSHREKSRFQHDFETRQYFQETVHFKGCRYKVSLPWADDKASMPNNFSLAKRRLNITIAKLSSNHLYTNYEKGFQEWLSEGII